jgi:uncharacterized membrane protein YhdT
VIAFLLVVATLVLFGLAGSNVRGRRFAPEWWAAACLVAVVFLTLLTHGP